MKNTPIPKALQLQAKRRKTKPPAVLAEQSALNAVLLGRKGGAHSAQRSRRELINTAQLKEAQVT